MFGESNAAPRILQKEATAPLLNELVCLQKEFQKLRNERLSRIENPELAD